MEKKTINSRQKGAAGERELAKVLREHGYSETRRGQQYCGSNGAADVVGLPGIYIECKRVQKLNLYTAMAQAVRDSKADDLPYDYDLPAVFHRKNNHEWLVTMRLPDFADMHEGTSENWNVRADYMQGCKGTVYDWMSACKEMCKMDVEVFRGVMAVPIVVHQKGKEPWLVTMRLEDWIIIYREYEAAMK